MNRQPYFRMSVTFEGVEDDGLEFRTTADATLQKEPDSAEDFALPLIDLIRSAAEGSGYSKEDVLSAIRLHS